MEFLENAKTACGVCMRQNAEHLDGVENIWMCASLSAGVTSPVNTRRLADDMAYEQTAVVSKIWNSVMAKLYFILPRCCVEIAEVHEQAEKFRKARLQTSN